MGFVPASPAGIQLARRQCGPPPNSRVLEPKGLSSHPVLTPAVQKGTHAAGLRLPSSGRPAPDAGPWLVSGNSDFRGFPPSPDKWGSWGLNCCAYSVVYTQHTLSCRQLPGTGSLMTSLMDSSSHAITTPYWRNSACPECLQWERTRQACTWGLQSPSCMSVPCAYSSLHPFSITHQPG